MIVYVVIYAPSNGSRGAKGYEFFLGSERRKAVDTLVQYVNHNNNTHNVTFKPLDIPANDRDAVQTWLKNHPEVTGGR